MLLHVKVLFSITRALHNSKALFFWTESVQFLQSHDLLDLGVIFGDRNSIMIFHVTISPNTGKMKGMPCVFWEKYSKIKAGN